VFGIATDVFSETVYKDYCGVRILLGRRKISMCIEIGGLRTDEPGFGVRHRIPKET
jgi:hypothetical protein